LQSLGFEDDMRRKVRVNGNLINIPEPDLKDSSLDGGSSLANTEYWKKYVASLSGLPAIKKSESSLTGALADAAKNAALGVVSADDVLGILENLSWSGGKKGGLLFGYQGDTYELRGKEIEKIETLQPSYKYMSEDPRNVTCWDQARLITFMDKLRDELSGM
jgi:hypothetical protein